MDKRWLAVKSVGGDGKALSFLDDSARTLLDLELSQLSEQGDEDADLLIADGRYGFAHDLAKDAIRHIRQVPKDMDRTHRLCGTQPDTWHSGVPAHHVCDVPADN